MEYVNIKMVGCITVCIKITKSMAKEYMYGQMDASMTENGRMESNTALVNRYLVQEWPPMAFG